MLGNDWLTLLRLWGGEGISQITYTFSKKALWALMAGQRI